MMRENRQCWELLVCELSEMKMVRKERLLGGRKQRDGTTRAVLLAVNLKSSGTGISQTIYQWQSGLVAEAQTALFAHALVSQ